MALCIFIVLISRSYHSYTIQYNFICIAHLKTTGVDKSA